MASSQSKQAATQEGHWDSFGLRGERQEEAILVI